MEVLHFFARKLFLREGKLWFFLLFTYFCLLLVWSYLN
ncbi:hypothetical protein P789_1641 [Enterococcus faecalis MTmid8]|nr:hypothetical protein P787_2432 [Enterococcus faecalis MN16]KAJ69970.1 hypothetical protein P789_1641 [Enterococcus faecalis MTmid8]KAJ80451.1 hypothetical protein P788_0905 [Enterococcus faecalis MTUP9]KAJ86628.1 hypothetical protein P791_0304 [Enterococcus faecalis NY9]OSH30355.1 hypothetical protein EFQH95_1034 [Enterococcus faecalis]